MNLNEKVSLITGASQGIGEVLARKIAGAGARVALLDIQQEKLESVAENIRAEGGTVSVHTTDVTQLELVNEAVEEVIREHDRIDHLVNNAGITRDNLLLRMKESEWDAVLAVNLKGVFNLSKAVVRHMLGNRSGRVVNISSVVGEMGNAGQTNYSASKAGVIGFTKSMAREVGSRGITVNAVAPGYISTAMTEALPESVKEGFMKLIPLRRFGAAEDVAAAVGFLLSEEAGYITGQVIHVNGGLYM